MSQLSTAELWRARQRGHELLRTASDPAGKPRVAVLSSFNVDLLPPLLADALHRAGLPAPQVSLGEFGQITQEALNARSQALAASPDVVVVIPAVEDLLSALYERRARLSGEQAASLVDDRISELQAALRALLARLPAAMLYVVAFGADRAPLEHVLDPASPQRGQWAIERFLWRLRQFGQGSPRIAVVDWDWHTRAAGRRLYIDERLWYLGRMRLNPLGLATLSELLAAHITIQHTAGRKAIAVDLDNTLWGGVIGEDGLKGIVCGEEGVGLAFADFQRELLALRETGVVLTICSKNNPADAYEALERHPGVVLRREHFAAERINWEDKATNIAALADELDLGLDSFAMLDDNPVERDYVRRALPTVAVPELPDDPVRRPAFLRGLPLFRRLSLTAADSERPRSYATHAARKRARVASISLADYIESLQQHVSIAAVDDASLARAAQLCQRTNQFNMTTKRYTVAELELMLAGDLFELYTASVSDRFGDSGITGLAILTFGDCGPDPDSARAEIDTFLLSCRVLGRGVEDELLAFIARRARVRGAGLLCARFIPTAKNLHAGGFYARAGFQAAADGQFSLDLAHSELGITQAPKE